MLPSYYIDGLMPKANAELAREYLGIPGEIEDARGPTGGLWRFENNTNPADPGAGKLRLDAGTWAGVANVFIDIISDGGVDATAFLNLLSTDDVLVIQDRDDATSYGRFTVSGSPVDNIGWFTIPVTHVKSGGDVPGNNEKLAVVAFYGG